MFAKPAFELAESAVVHASLFYKQEIGRYRVGVYMNLSVNYSGKSALKILHLIPSIGTSSGGLGPVALGFSREQKRLGCNPTIWTLEPSSVTKEFAASNGLNINDIKSFNALGPVLLHASNGTKQQQKMVQHLTCCTNIVSGH